MAPSASPARNAARGANLTVLRGSRGVPERVTQRRTDALAPCLEGIAICDEAIASSERIAIALANRAPYAVQHEANRLRGVAERCRTELRRMAGVLDGGRAA